MYVGSSSENMERAHWTTLHSTSMPAGPLVYAVHMKVMTKLACKKVCGSVPKRKQVVCGNAQWVYVGSSSENMERAHLTTLHSTSMPAGQKVYALRRKVMSKQACKKVCGSVPNRKQVV